MENQMKLDATNLVEFEILIEEQYTALRFICG